MTSITELRAIEATGDLRARDIRYQRALDGAATVAKVIGGIAALVWAMKVLSGKR